MHAFARGEGEAASPVGARDAGLRRLGRLRRWSAIGGLALAGAIAGLVAQGKPGKSSSTAPAASPGGAGTTGAVARHLPSGSLVGGGGGLDPSSSGSSISPPPATPTPAPATPSAPVSGGS